MKWIIKYFLTCIFLFGIYSTKGYSENVNFNFPDSLIACGQLQDARIELEKIAFFNSQPDIITKALIKKAYCYKMGHNFKKSYSTLNRIFLLNQPDSLLFHIKYEKALSYYLNSEPGRAIFELQSLSINLTDKEKTSRIKFLSALSYAELKNWGKAKKEASEYLTIQINNTAQLIFLENELETLFLKKNIPKTLSKKTAKNLSSFIPGGGQFYAGKIGEGIFSVGLHAALIYFGVSQFLDKFYFTGYSAGFGLLQKLYSGNLKRVQNLVEEVNTKNQDKFFNDLFTILTVTPD